MTRICFLLLILLIHVSCIYESQGEKALANFTKKFNHEISKDYGLSLFGSGASFPVKIEDIILSYKANHSENIEGARKLVVEIAHKMIKRMNDDNNLLKYLSANPASVRNVELTIIFKDPVNGRCPGSLSSVSVIGLRSKVLFNTYSLSEMLVTLHEEEFDEAEKLVSQDSSSSNTH